MIRIFYHDDLDGRLSAYLALKFAAVEGEKWLQIPMNYDKPFPMETIRKNDRVYLLDYHISPEDMTTLKSIVPAVTWIDHHISSIEKFKDYPGHIDGLRRDGMAACMLTYEYFLPEFTGLPEEAFPYYIRLVADRDVWAWRYGEDTVNFCSALDALDTSPDNIELWRQARDNPEHFLKMGKVVNQYKTMRNQEIIVRNAYLSEFEGLRAICCNCPRADSNLFDGIDPNSYEIMAVYSYTGEVWCVSLYTKRDDIDVSRIAMKYGGGGHKQAAGFTTKDFLFAKKAS